MSGRKKAKRKIVYGRNPQNFLSMILVGMVLLAIFVAVMVRGVSLRATLQEYEETKAALEAEIEAELERAEEIEEYAKYTQTDEYVEEVARDKLGLVKEGEILFKNDEDAASASSSSTSDTADEEEMDSASSTSTDTSDSTETTSSDSAAEDTAAATSADGDTTETAALTAE